MNKLITPNFIKHWAIQNPRKISIIWGDKKYSYYWTADSIAKFIIFLKLQGLKKEQTVVIKVNHRVLELIITFALEAIGAIRVAQIEDSKLAEKCNFCISDHKLEKLNIKNIHLTTSLLETIFSYELLPEDLNLLDYAPQPDDLILISHTSGTTGKKKYFADTHYGLWANLFLMKSIYFANDEDTFLSINSIAVGAAYAGCCLALICGGKIIFTNEDCLLSALDSNTKSHVALVLKDAMYLYDKYPNFKAKNKISTLRVLGAALPTKLRLWLEEHVTKKVFNSYSSNETGQIGEVSINGTTRIYEGVNVKIVNDQWEDLGFNSTGFITVKSAQLIPEYIWDEELNSLHFKDGWYRTNDLGYMPNVKELVVLDRADHMLILGGVKIPPLPLEANLKKFPGIQDIVLCNPPSSSDPDKIIACVCINENANKAIITNAINEVLKNLTNVKVKIQILYFDDFPKTETGKVQRFKLINSVI